MFCSSQEIVSDSLMFYEGVSAQTNECLKEVSQEIQVMEELLTVMILSLRR